MSDRGEVYLSLVATARNDDHGGNLLGRMQAFVSGFLEQCKRFNISSELVLVEWNPPADRPRLKDALKWSVDGPCAVRIIEVPADVHTRFKYAKALPLYQMIAKNVGIRRTRGRFVLATNIDILISDELAAFLGEQKLERGRMYRIDRHDAMSGVPVRASVEEMLAYCRTHLIRVNAREGTFTVTPEGERALANEDLVAPALKDQSTPARPGVLFGLGWYAVEKYSRQEPFRWAGPRAELLLDDAGGQPAMLHLDVEPGPGTAGGPRPLAVGGADGKLITPHTPTGRSTEGLPPPHPPPRPAFFLSR